jgi:large subunit ribosomal protein L10
MIKSALKVIGVDFILLFYIFKKLGREVDLAKKEKIDEVNELREIFKSDSGLIFTDHSGLKAEDAVRVRDRLVEIDSYLRIIKNTLALIAAEDVLKGIDIKEILKGPTSIVVSSKDIISAAKVISDFSEELDTLKIKAGMLENKLLSSEEMEKLAKLPSRELLLANLMMSIKSPIIKLINILGSLTSSLVLVLDAIRKRKGDND